MGFEPKVCFRSHVRQYPHLELHRVGCGCPLPYWNDEYVVLEIIVLWIESFQPIYSDTQYLVLKMQGDDYNRMSYVTSMQFRSKQDD